MCGPSVLNLGDSVEHLGIGGMTSMQALGKQQKVTWEEHLTNRKAKLSVAAENPIRALFGTSCVAKTSISLKTSNFFLKLFLFSLITSLHFLVCYYKGRDSEHSFQGPWQKETTYFLKESTPSEKQQPRNLIGASVLKKSQSQHLSMHSGPSFQKPGGVNRKFLHSDSQLCLSKHLPPSTGSCTSSFHLLLQGMPALEDSRDQKHCNCTVYKLRGWWEPLVLLPALSTLMTAEV